MLRRIIPTAERTVTRGGDNTIDKGGAIRERPRMAGLPRPMLVRGATNEGERPLFRYFVQVDT